MRALLVAALTLVLIAGPAAADDDEGYVDPQTHWQVGVDLGAMLPRGDWPAKSGMGGLARFEWMPWRPIGLSLRGGYFNHFSKHEGDLAYSTREVPLLLGLRLSVGSESLRVYAVGEVGYVAVDTRVKDNIDNTRESEWRTKLGGAAGGGVQWTWFDMRAMLFMPRLSGEGEKLRAVLITAGFLASF